MFLRAATTTGIVIESATIHLLYFFSFSLFTESIWLSFDSETTFRQGSVREFGMTKILLFQ